MICARRGSSVRSGENVSKIVKRPWGRFRQFTENIPTTVKIITVEKGEKTSLQFHNHRDELWVVLKGECLFHIGDNVHKGNEGDEFFVSRKEKHRIASTFAVEVEVLEISFGYFDEEDIIRLEDDYGR